MGTFSGLPVVEFCNDGIHVVFIAPFSYTTNSGKIHTIEPGFMSDGISLPTLFYTVLNTTPFTTKALPGAFIHDMLYNTKNFDKDEADLVLHEACISNGLSKWMADIIYEGVHVGGASSFSADQLRIAALDGALSPAVSIEST